MAKSGRGGARSSGGRPSRWQNQPTQTVRVPTVFADFLLEIVKQLDSGAEEVIIIDPKSLEVSQQVKRNQVVVKQPRKYSHSGHAVLRVQELIQFLQGYVP